MTCCTFEYQPTDEQLKKWKKRKPRISKRSYKIRAKRFRSELQDSGRITNVGLIVDGKNHSFEQQSDYLWRLPNNQSMDGIHPKLNGDFYV